MGSASAKWALMAPVFVPMFMLLGYSPELTQVAYRVGDSVTNIIAPMMSYFALIIAFVQRYEAKAGIGTLVRDAAVLRCFPDRLVHSLRRVDPARLAGRARSADLATGAGPVGMVHVGAVSSRNRRHSASTSSRSVGSEPIETRTIQRPSSVAGVR